MNIKSIWSVMAIAVLTAVLCQSCSSDDFIPEKFPGQKELNVKMISSDATKMFFTSKASETYEFAVEAGSKWWVQTDADWLNLVKKDDKLIVTAQKNRTLEEKNTTITFTDGQSQANFEVNQEAGKVKIYNIDGTTKSGVGGIPARAVSGNGRYVLGSSSNGTWVCDLWSIKNLGENNTINALDIIFYPGMTNMYSVSNKGIPVSNGCTPDGNTLVSYETKNMFAVSYITKNGVKTELPAPAAYETEVGTAIPNGGHMAFWVSDDAKYISGRHQIARGQVVECGWKLNELTGKYEYSLCGKDYIEVDEDSWGTRVFWVEAMSQNGRYVVGRSYGMAEGADVFPFCHDVETGEYHLLKDLWGLSASMVTNDGDIAVAGMLGDTEFINVNDKEGKKTRMIDWLTQQFKLSDEDKSIMGYTSGIMRARCINPEKSAACFAYYPNGDVQQLQWSLVITIE